MESISPNHKITFSNKTLFDMILPLVFEHLLALLVGLADTFIISSAGETAVSGVSLVNSFNNIFLYIFTALAAGGAVVVSQYLGRRDNDLASESISQLLMFSSLLSLIITVVVLLFNRAILSALFGQVEDEVMQSALTYLRISAYSYPAIAIYNTGAAMYRCVGRTRTTMNISIIANIINVVGNIIGVYVLKAGVAGVAYPSLIARVFSAAAITALCFEDRYGLRYRVEKIFQWNGDLLRRILHIAVPNSFESGVFQFVKVALTGMVATFGTYQIAANGIAQSIWSLSVVASTAMESVFITVIGRCMGAGDTEQATYYFKKLLVITYACTLVWNVVIIALTPFVLRFYNISPEARSLTIALVNIHSAATILLHPTAFPFGKGLRAAGDVRFATGVCIFTSICMRLAFSYVFAVLFGMGVLGVVWAMNLDWTVRIIFFVLRFRSGKWKNFKVI